MRAQRPARKAVHRRPARIGAEFESVGAKCIQRFPGQCVRIAASGTGCGPPESARKLRQPLCLRAVIPARAQRARRAMPSGLGGIDRYVHARRGRLQVRVRSPPNGSSDRRVVAALAPWMSPANRASNASSAPRATTRLAGRRGRAAQGGEPRAAPAPGHLPAERATLMQKNEQVRARVEAMIGRLKASRRAAHERRPEPDQREDPREGVPRHLSRGRAPGADRPAEHLNRKMREIRDSGKVIGLDRIAVMAALNIVNDLAAAVTRPRRRVETDLAARIKAMRERASESAADRSQLGNRMIATRAGCASDQGLAPPAVFDLRTQGTSRP